MATAFAPGRLLITGASSKLGLVTLYHLLHTLHVGPLYIVVGTRSPHSDVLQIYKEQGVDVRFFDANDAASVAAAAEDVERVLLISNGENDNGSSHVRAIRALVKAGVQHIVYTTLQAADVSLATIAPIHHTAGEILKQSSVPSYAALRNLRTCYRR